MPAQAGKTEACPREACRSGKPGGGANALSPASFYLSELSNPLEA